MADLDAYWSQIKSSEKFQDLEPDKKEQVRQHLFNQYVQTAPSYSGLPQSQRLKVKSHFDEVTKIEEESMGESMIRKAKPIIQKGKELLAGAADAVDLTKLPGELGEVVDSGVEIPGAKKAAGFVRQQFEDTASLIEPSDEGYGRIGNEFGTVKSWNPLTQFDMARAIAGGAIRGTGEALAGLIPETTMGASLFFTDPVLKYAGTTFLGKELKLPWKPKTGLSEADKTLGADLEKMITQENINQHVRMNIDAMKGGPPAPLEALGHKEEMLKAQDELNGYEEWLKQADNTSNSPGEHVGDLHPEAKVNVSQLRDAARDRLQKLQDEPVRVESLSKAEDALQGYYRRKIDQTRVYMMPEGQPVAPQKMLPPGEERLKLGPGNVPQKTIGGVPHEQMSQLSNEIVQMRKIGKAKKPEVLSSLPPGSDEEVAKIASAKSPSEIKNELSKLHARLRKAGSSPEEAMRTLRESFVPGSSSELQQTPRSGVDVPPLPSEAPSGLRAKDVLTKAYSAYHPGETKQAIGIRAGTLLKALGFKPERELNTEELNLIEKLLDSEHADLSVKTIKNPSAASRVSEVERLKEKGIDPLEVQAEAKRLQSEHDAQHLSIAEERARLKEVTGGVALHAPDPMTGKIPEAEEVRTGVPRYLRGTTPPDQAAQMAYDAGLIQSPDAGTLIEYAKKFEDVQTHRSAKSFLDEAEYRLEMENHRDAGFKQAPAQETLPETPGAEMPKTGLGGAEGQVSGDDLLEGFQNQDITQKPLFDIVSDIGKEGLRKLEGEGGGFNTEDFDPMRQAALEANIKELVMRARAMGYETTQDIMLYAARHAPAELQDAMRKNLAPTLSAFDTHGYKELEAARQGNPIAKKDMMDQAQRGYFQQKAAIVKGVYKKFKANQQVVLFKDMDEGLMRLKNDLFIHDNYRKFSKDELAAQRWYIEGKSPKLESLTALGVKEDVAKRWLDLAKNPTENMKSARAMTQTFEDEYYDVISEFYDKVGYVEDHVTRRWKQSREYLDWEGKTLGNRPNFLKGRKLLSQADGINAGYEPISWDIRDDLRASNNTRVNILSRIHAYQKLGASFGEKGGPAIIDESKDLMTQAKNAKITPHAGEAPNSWMRFEHVPLLKGLAIDPYYQPALKFMMSKRFTGTAPEVLDFLSASTKATKLYGFFHGYTLGEMTLSGISYRDVFSFAKDRNPLFKGLRYFAEAATADMNGKPLSKNPIKAIGELYDSFITGHAVLANRPLALEMAENGFKFGSADEDMHGVLTKTLNQLEGYLKERIGAKAAKGITVLPRTAIELQEKALWSYIRPISSMLVYETNLKDAILKFNLEAEEGLKIPVEQIKQAIVNQTSKEMGGISYARLMIDPRTQQVLQWAMLAPGWTIGRALMGASVLEKGPEGRQARKQMAKLFVGWFFASNMINYAQTKKYLGKGRYMWENPEGYRNQAFLSKEADGSTRYMQLSKALTEIYDDVMYPAKTAAYKLSAPVQGAAKVMNWATARAYYPGVEPENPLKTALHMYEPMITSGQSAYGGMPVKRGPSKNKIEAVLDRYYKDGMKDNALFEEAMQMATEEGYDIGKLDRAVRANRTRKENQAMFK